MIHRTEFKALEEQVEILRKEAEKLRLRIEELEKVHCDPKEHPDQHYIGQKTIGI